jgi:hypothetical protein
VSGRPAGLREAWQEGRAFLDLAARLAALAEAREGIEAARKVHFYHLQASVITVSPCHMRNCLHLLVLGVLSSACMACCCMRGGIEGGREPTARMHACMHIWSAAECWVVTRAQAMRKKLPPPENTLSQPAPNQAAGQAYIAPEDYVAQDEIYKVPSNLQYSMLPHAHSGSPMVSAEAAPHRVLNA